MAKEAVMNYARTVLGDIAEDDLGITLSHEHLICDSRTWLAPPPHDPIGRELAAAPEPTLDTLWWHRQFPNSNASVLVLNDEPTAIDELNAFARLGGGTLVELTCEMGRNLPALQRISAATGIHVIAGTGYY